MLNDDCICKLIEKNFKERLNKIQIRQLPYLSKDKISQSKFEFCYLFVKMKLRKEKYKILRDKKKKTTKSVTIELSLEEYSLLDQFSSTIFFRKRKTADIIQYLLKNSRTLQNFKKSGGYYKI